jgi:hypothetical protein
VDAGWAHLQENRVAQKYGVRVSRAALSARDAPRVRWQAFPYCNRGAQAVRADPLAGQEAAAYMCGVAVGYID